MTDARLEELLDAMAGAPRIVVGRHKFVVVDDVVVVETRVGKGERWAFAPGRDVHRVMPYWYPREARAFVERARLMNWPAYLRAMSARVL